MKDFGKPVLLLRALGSALVLMLAFLSFRYLAASRPYVGSVDFHYYALFARDLAAGARDVPAMRYAYFPGVYTFWTAVFRLTGGGLASLQGACLGLIAVNAALVGAIVGVSLGSWEAVVLAAGVYIFMAGRVEGFCGVTEPLGTIPFLAGLLAWIHLTSRNRTRAGLFALGAGFGLALYAKQQAGLLALGALPLLPFPRGRGRAYDVAEWLILPGVASAIFLFAMFLEGGGMTALRAGLLQSGAYQANGTLAEHLAAIREATAPVSSLYLSACVLWLGMALFPPERPEAMPEMRFRTLGVCIFSALACLIQFSKRGYYHYALLPLPSAIIASALALEIVVGLLRNWARSRLHGVILTVIGVAAFLLLNSAGAVPFFSYALAQVQAPTHWFEAEEQARRFAPLCARLRPGSELLLLPSRQDFVHLACGTRSSSPQVGYAWPIDDAATYLQAAARPESRAVFIFSADDGPFERGFFSVNKHDEVVGALARMGYHKTLGIAPGELFERGADSGAPGVERPVAQKP